MLLDLTSDRLLIAHVVRANDVQHSPLLVGDFQAAHQRADSEGAVLITVGNSDVRYAHLVEYGTANSPAQP